MAKLTKEQQISRLEKTAKYHDTKARREWAYAKNDLGDEHYGRAKDHFKQAKELIERAKRLKEGD
ncbi:hypothetical protein [Oribacterium sp. NK2B42]|uniref:hypothetical protein n=1 Tax=Oribacterium sp. NK2B42 TaxID=689781 RepID=UPI0004239873|nr:hypothetical protein [Oribacterium sp. NK2B42]